jgi:hypothetical protein
MSKRVREQLRETMEEAALEAVKEIREFLGTYRGKDPERFRRVSIAVSMMSGYSRLLASQNNTFSMMLIAARLAGIGPQQTLDMAKSVGLLPESAESAEVINLKAAKSS